MNAMDNTPTPITTVEQFMAAKLKFARLHTAA